MTQKTNLSEIRAKINQQIENGDFTGWFETLYSGAGQNADIIPWSHTTTNPLLTEWLDKNELQGVGRRAIVIGCGLGDDAEKLAELGFQVTAFDISTSAITWAKQRFPDTSVDYQVADLFNLPADWHGQFDFVLEIFTVQALPLAIRDDALTAIPPLLSDKGQLLLICFGRDHHETSQGPPWAISKQELDILNTQTLRIEHDEEFVRNGSSRYFRILYGK